MGTDGNDRASDGNRTRFAQEQREPPPCHECLTQTIMTVKLT